MSSMEVLDLTGSCIDALCVMYEFVRDEWKLCHVISYGILARHILGVSQR